MKFLGIDYGGKRIGLAVSDEGGTIAFPRETIANMRGVIGSIQKLIAEEKIGFVVVGDTQSYGGIPNPITFKVKEFVEDLKKVLDVPIASSWEAGSTMEANRYDPDGEHNDAAAAAIILQRYLDIKTGSVD
ncbi:MAG: Holliday junction resolvase RuvX [Candidatus Pacebacteria bacterium]|nr:Holliday junction resolvase RuvX [Candidatus Paceibacterota bacterium]